MHSVCNNQVSKGSAALIRGFYLWDCLRASEPQARRNVNVIRRFVQAVRVHVDRIRPRNVEDYLLDLLTAGRAIKTIRNHLGSISVFCEFCIARDLMDVNPCAKVTLPRKRRCVPIFLNVDERIEALRIARETDRHCEVCLAMNTGLRMTELRNLMWIDVDLNARTLLVRESKSGRPRTVPLNTEALAALDEQGERSGHLPHVFPGGKSRDLPRPRGQDWWAKVAIVPLQAKIAKFQVLPKGSTGRGWHLLRHTFASRLAQKGVSLYKISKWLGHKSCDTTQIYAHLSPGYDADIE